MSSTESRMSPDIEGVAQGVTLEPAQRIHTAKMTMWQSIRNNPKVIFIALFASLGGFEYGYQQGVLGQSLVMTRFIKNFPSVVNSSSATGWLTSILQLGGLAGSLSAGVLSEVISRKYTMFIACLWVILGSYLYIGAHEGMPSLLYAGRFFTAALRLCTTPSYPPEMRGLLVSSYQLATILGIMLSFWIGYGSNYIGGTGDSQLDLAWRLPSIIQGIPAVFLAVGIWFMPFSPRWLVKVGRDEEAKSTLAWMKKLSIDDDRVQVEYLEIKAEAVFEKKAFAREYPQLAAKDKQNLWVQQFAHYLLCYEYLHQFGVDWWNNGVVGNWCDWRGVLSQHSASHGSVVMAVSMIIVGVIVAKFRHDWPAHKGAGWVAVALIWVYIAGFGATWGPVSWTLISEIFPLSIRAKGVSIGAASNWLNNFAIAFFTPPMLKHWAWGTYIFFSVFLVAGIVWVWFCLPETKNATLEEMDHVFKSNTGERDAILLRESQEEVGLVAFVESRTAPFNEKRDIQEAQVESI
ncbi:High-affinity hexose transporter ght4-like protein [Cladobotryum mycophilum]|uniref:High-affinity hexose transporter ght4-like protein n=1 Tax=Cladobotryum mycophilum TaxID=491253 RepID=A0ABR0SND5_9HYPO